MDAQLLIVTLAGLLTTLIGAIMGPQFLDRQRRRLDQQLRSQTARERPYIDFATAIERLQLDLDLMASGVCISQGDYFSHFRAMEESRSKLDLVGTQSARVWAYRCRLAATSMSKLFHNPDMRAHFRRKLHEARSEFVTYARAEVGLASDELPAPVKASEDSAAGHAKWLEFGADLPDLEHAVRIASTEFGEWTLPFDQASDHLAGC